MVVMKNILRSLVGFAVLVVLVFLASNSMPFYADGSRMGLFDGVPAIIDGASWTMPFAEGASRQKRMW
jgi:hypothetical protein